MLNWIALGNQVRELRTAKSISQQQLADEMFLTRKTISNWETGFRHPDISMMFRLADALDVDAAALFNTLQGPEGDVNVIVVEDEPIILKGCVHVLGGVLGGVLPDAQVYGFQGPEEAAIFASGNRVSIAFLDVELCAGENGVGLAGKLLQIYPRTNVIFLTGHPEYMAAAWELHSSGFVVKPLTPDKARSELSNLRFPIRGLSI